MPKLEDKDYTTQSSINPLAAGLMAAGDAISGIYGQRGNTYSNYLDAQAKRQQMGLESQRYSQTEAQKNIDNQIKLIGVQQAQQGLGIKEIQAMGTSGFTPTNRGQLLNLDPMERMNLLKSRQIGPVSGTTYIPNESSKVDPSVAQKIANYDIDIKTIPGFGKSSVRNAYLKQVAQLNPEYDQKQYEASKTFMNGLAKTQRGTPGGIVNSANTLIGHLDFLDKKIDELGTGQYPAKHVLVNFARTQLGKESITNFKQAKEVVDAELEGLLTGVGATQQGLAARRTLLSENASKEQMKGAIKTIVQIMKSRTEPIEKQYKTYGGKDKDRIFSPYSREVLGRFEDTSRFTVNGKVYNIPKEDVASFKKEMGIKDE